MWRFRLNSVASGALKEDKNAFKKHEKYGFSDHLKTITKKKNKLGEIELLLHKNIERAIEGAYDNILEVQWKTMVHEMLKLNKHCNFIVVCDVSLTMARILIMSA